MKIPERFKQKQAEVFQDKAVEHYLPVVTKGALNTETTAPAQEASGTYRVNFRTVTDALKAQEYGLTVGRDAAMKSSNPLPVMLGDFIRHGGKLYRVVGDLPRDAYVGWLLKGVS